MNYLEKITINKNKEKNNFTNVDIALIQIITKKLNNINYNERDDNLFLLNYKQIADILIRKNILKESRNYHVKIVKKSIHKLIKRPGFYVIDFIEEDINVNKTYIYGSLFDCDIITEIREGGYKKQGKYIGFRNRSRYMCNLYLSYFN